jgi:hypothetical protein
VTSVEIVTFEAMLYFSDLNEFLSMLSTFLLSDLDEARYKRSDHIMLMRISENRCKVGHAFLIDVNEVNSYSCTVNPNYVQKVKHVLVNSVYCVTEYTICNIRFHYSSTDLCR